jgi:hypothetical protein
MLPVVLLEVLGAELFVELVAVVGLVGRFLVEFLFGVLVEVFVRLLLTETGELMEEVAAGDGDDDPELEIVADAG